MGGCKEPHIVKVQKLTRCRVPSGLLKGCDEGRPSPLAYPTHRKGLSIIENAKDKTGGNILDDRLCFTTQPAIPATSRMGHEALKRVELLPWSSTTFASATVRLHKPDP